MHKLCSHWGEKTVSTVMNAPLGRYVWWEGAVYKELRQPRRTRSRRTLFAIHKVGFHPKVVGSVCRILCLLRHEGWVGEAQG